MPTETPPELSTNTLSSSPGKMPDELCDKLYLKRGAKYHTGFDIARMAFFAARDLPEHGIDHWLRHFASQVPDK